MARINVDDQFWDDVTEVILRLGERDRAVGLAIRWVQYTQRKHKLGEAITLEEFQARFHMCLVPEFAKVEGDLVRPMGCADQHDWLTVKQQSASKGGAAKTEAKKQAAIDREQKKRNKNSSVADHKQPQAKQQNHKQPQASPSFSPSPSFSDSSSDSENKENTNSLQDTDLFGNPSHQPSAAADNKALNRKIWDAYKAAFIKRYGVEPQRNAMVNKQVDNLRARVGEDAIQLVVFYVEHRDKWYVGKQHAIAFCLKDAESLLTQMRRGKPVTHTEMREYERRSGHMQLLEEIRKEREAQNQQEGEHDMD